MGVSDGGLHMGFGPSGMRDRNSQAAVVIILCEVLEAHITLTRFDRHFLGFRMNGSRPRKLIRCSRFSQSGAWVGTGRV